MTGRSLLGWLYDLHAPPQVKRAVALLWLSLVASAVLMVLEVDLADLTQAMGWSDDWLRWWFWLSLFATEFALALLLIFIGKRRNWARVLYLIITVTATAGFLYPLEGVNAAYWDRFSFSTWVFFAMDVVALYWLFSAPASDWYRQARRSE